MHPEEQHLPFKQTGTNSVFGHVLIHSVNKSHVLFVTVELIWLLFLNIPFFNFVPTPNKFLRLERFRKSYVNHPDVALTSLTSYTAFLLDGHCAVQVVTFLFLQLFVPIASAFG